MHRTTDIAFSTPVARPRLSRLIAKARTLPPTTPAQAEDQRRSFVTGNVALANPAVTRELVDEVAQAHVENAGRSLDSSAVMQGAPRMGDWMQTYTGRQFWPMDPRIEDVDIRDIAHSLSMQCRYAGHCLRFYSVAEHSVHVARWLQAQESTEVTEEVILKGLLHDAPEAYLVDVPRPVKPFLAGYKNAEAAVWKTIASWAGMSDAMPNIVHEADNRILNDERDQNMSLPPIEWAHTGQPLGITLQFWSPEAAREKFLDMFRSITARGIK